MNENLIHVKVDYLEALETKRDVLKVEKNLLTLNEILRNFNSFKAKKMKAKIKLHKKIKELLSGVKEMRTLLPKAKIPKMLHEKIENKGKSEIVKRVVQGSIEEQLRDIQEKLKRLQK